jgi:hypothetical protein
MLNHVLGHKAGVAGVYNRSVPRSAMRVTQVRRKPVAFAIV